MQQFFKIDPDQHKPAGLKTLQKQDQKQPQHI